MNKYRPNEMYKAFIPSFILNRRNKVMEDIPKTINESYERDAEAIKRDWEAVLGDFNAYKTNEKDSGDYYEERNRT